MVGSKQTKARGTAFELRVRKDMTEKGWIVDKFGNNVEFIDEIELPDLTPTAKNKSLMRLYTGTKKEPGKLGRLITAKNKWAGPNRPMMMGAGFPDFVCFKRYNITPREYKSYQVIGVECKCNGYLSQLEREKCQWFLDNNVFSKILIAEKTKPKNRILIVYHDFKDKYGETMQNGC